MSDWISVKDKNPRGYEDVLTYREGCDDQDVEFRYENGWSSDPRGDSNHFPVTHWMPLPEPPK